MFHMGRLKAEKLTREREKQQRAALEGSSSTPAITEGSSSTPAITDENGSRRLLPGIPHDLTVRMITTKLSWSSVGALSSVSRAWQRAVRSHEIHVERTRFHSTEAFVVLNYALSVSENKTGIALYSLQTGACRQLPPIPHVKNGIPDLCQCTTLDGRIYILGGLQNTGENNSTNYPPLSQADVYMFDVAGLAQTWEKCASMYTARCSFGCGTIEGKIYVCGGSKSSGLTTVPGTEMYDPKVDAWTELMPMLTQRKGHKVAIVEKELVVYGGVYFRNGFWNFNFQLQNLHVPGFPGGFPADNLEIYNPTTGKWRRLPYQVPNNPGMDPGDWISKTMFAVEGKLHAITGSAVFQLDLEQDVSTRLHHIKQRKRNYWTPYTTKRQPLAVLAVDDQLVAFDYWYEYQYIGRRVESDQDGDLVVALLSGSGFGVNDQDIVWERVLYSLSFDGLKSTFLHILRV